MLILFDEKNIYETGSNFYVFIYVRYTWQYFFVHLPGTANTVWLHVSIKIDMVD